MRAANERGYTDIVKLLLSMDAGSKCSGSGGNGHTDTANLLVGSGAVGNGHIDVVKLLIDNGADVNADHPIMGAGLHCKRRPSAGIPKS